MTKLIEHTGIVDRSEAGRVFVRIAAGSACGACRVREACGMGEAREKVVEVVTSEALEYTAGEEVSVGVKRGVGGAAVVLAYVGALVVLIAVLAAALLLLGWSEGSSALAALLGVGAYYYVLWLLRRKIENRIHFTITKR